ncbi:MAG TPA: TonB family protein [Thermoanaerobaculia bacterium]|jgi:TonB family protein|nr:TonB family protein [Thermoanaerobaculia bacterium]
MSERKPCTRCGRSIDGWSKICPFCNQDQNAPVPAVTAQPREVLEYKPPAEFDLKKKAIMGGAGVLALVAAFGVGMVINSDGAPETAPETIEQQIAEDQQKVAPIKRADTPLVPTNERGGVEQPITSAPVAAPAGTPPNDYQRTDATAVSATEYAEMAKRAKQERDRMSALVDPRSLTGPAYAQAPRAVRPRPAAAPQNAQLPPPMPGQAPQDVAPQQPQQQQQPPQVEARRARNSLRTRPVPQSQPLPDVRGRGTARLSLLIGADGRVKEVDIMQPLAGGNTAQLLRAVQQWRFKPATENGEPVAAPYTVEISFR